LLNPRKMRLAGPAVDPNTIDRLNAQDAQEWIRCASRGDFDGAWVVSDRIRQRDSRSGTDAVPRHFQRIWDGRPFDGRRVLIRCYHGLGDTIHFIRYVPLVQHTAHDVIVWAQRDLLSLLERAYCGVKFLELHDGTPDVEYDVDIEIMELPYAFRTTLATIPADIPYLHPPAATLPDRGLPRASSRRGPRVGIVWRAGDWDTRRSIPFHLIKRLLDLHHIEFYRVQYNSYPSETHANLHPFPNASVWLTAQFTRALDLVISVDSMPAHLAGALGVPVWTLVTDQADWRWLRDRDDSPWYPTMRLFRQRSPGEWGPVIEDVRTALQALRLGR
jgi:hypothetical protein